MNASPRVGFIGAGRVARALSRAFANAGGRVVAIASRTNASAEICAQAVAGCKVMDTAQEVANAVDLVFLAVPDDAISRVAGQVTWRDGISVVHCSGASELDVLAAAQAAGAAIGSFHPLVMFADTEVALAALPKSAVALEAGPPLDVMLEGLVRRIGATPLHVPPGARAAYHAASHYGAAFICVLVEQGKKIMEAAGVRGDASHQALLALARGTLDAMAATPPAQAMAGVYARGDLGTAARHLQALDALDSEVAALYRELAKKSLSMASSAGRIDAATAATIKKLLEKTPRS